ncbi:MAG: hypothetical protein EB032_13190 [Betaproteobacteria bacterium]|nr:hypothetical protein [Betaproteobacteria bacterium]
MNEFDLLSPKRKAWTIECHACFPDWQHYAAAACAEELPDGLWALSKKAYFAEGIKGSSSIKKVLPSLMKRSEVLKGLYSGKVYGSAVAGALPAPMASKNFKDFAWWVPEASNPSVPVEPYELLRRYGADLLGEEVRAGEDPDELAITEGGAAATAYARLQFEDVDAATRLKIREALLRYCELDTLAMVMIVQGWRGLIQP